MSCQLSPLHGDFPYWLPATAVAGFGLVVSNAGFTVRVAFGTTDAAEMGDMLAVNCHAPMRLAHGLRPRRRRLAGRRCMLGWLQWIRTAPRGCTRMTNSAFSAHWRSSRSAA